MSWPSPKWLLDLVSEVYRRIAGDSKEQRDAVDKDKDDEMRRRRKPKPKE